MRVSAHECKEMLLTMRMYVFKNMCKLTSMSTVVFFLCKGCLHLQLVFYSSATFNISPM